MILYIEDILTQMIDTYTQGEGEGNTFCLRGKVWETVTGNKKNKKK